MSDLAKYFPPILQNIRDFKEVASTENIEVEQFNNGIDKVLSEQFVMTASPEAMTRYEKMYRIATIQGDNLQFRKERILNRLRLVPPYTKKFLMQRLDEVIGVGKWILDIDYDNYIFYIESSAVNQNWFEEIYVTIGIMKPCNMVFINRPYDADNIRISEEVERKTIVYNYYLGSWELGKKPFAHLLDNKVIKKGDIMSVADYLLLKLAENALSRVENIRLNDAVNISDFTIRRTERDDEGTSAVLEYKVIPSPELGKAITNVKLLNDHGGIVTESTIYVPVIGDMLIKHTIRIKEGV